MRYKMDAECQFDVGRFLQKIHVLNIIATQMEIGVDMEVEFTSPRSLSEIRKALSEIEDGHVMAETVELKEFYTGERG